MRLKLDENLRNSGVEALRAAGHDVETVIDEGLQTAPDQTILEACKAEGRCLITLDTDFANPFRYPPGDAEGIIVIRMTGSGKAKLLAACIERIVNALDNHQITGRLWIVDPGRIREYRATSEES